MPRIEWTPEQDSTLREHHARGESLATIADAIGEIDNEPINIGHVSRRMKRLGLIPNNAVPAATEAVKAKLTEQREHLAALALIDAYNLRDRLWEEHTVWMNGPDGPERVTLDLPDAKAVNDFTSAIERLVKTHENLERIGKARIADVAKSNLNALFDMLKAAVGDDEL